MRRWIPWLMFAGPSLVGAQTSQDATFYLVANSDTAVVERMTRTPIGFRSQVYTKAGVHMEIVASVDSQARVTSAALTVFRRTDTIPVQHILASFDGDSAGVSNNGKMNWVHAGPSPIPNVSTSSALLEQLLRRARMLGGPAAQLTFLGLPSGPGSPVTVTWIGTDSAQVQVSSVIIRLAVSPSGQLLGGVIPSQGVRIVRGPPTTTALRAGKSYDAPPGAPYTAEEVVVVTQAGLHLFGTLTSPRGAKARVPAIVTITGSGSQDRDDAIDGLPKYGLYRQLSDTLSRRGIAVLRLDDRGVNGSDLGPPSATTADFADDIRAAVAFLRARSDIDPRRIGVVGHSEGGTIGPMVAASDSVIAAVVVMAGAVSTGREIVTFQQHVMVDSVAHLVGRQRDAALAQYARNTDSAAAALPWWGFFLSYDGAATAARVRAPVLILHGERDYQVPTTEAEKLAAAFRGGGNRDVTVRLFAATNHLFVPDSEVGFSYVKLTDLRVRPVVLGAVADWLVERLKP